jgi:hypothetical protein
MGRHVETGGFCEDDDVYMDSYRWAAMWDAHKCAGKCVCAVGGLGVVSGPKELAGADGGI